MGREEVAPRSRRGAMAAATKQQRHRSRGPTRSRSTADKTPLSPGGDGEIPRARARFVRRRRCSPSSRGACSNIARASARGATAVFDVPLTAGARALCRTRRVTLPPDRREGRGDRRLSVGALCASRSRSRDHISRSRLKSDKRHRTSRDRRRRSSVRGERRR